MNKEDAAKRQLEAARMLSDHQREKDLQRLKGEWAQQAAFKNNKGESEMKSNINFHNSVLVQKDLMNIGIDKLRRQMVREQNKEVDDFNKYLLEGNNTKWL